MNGIGRLSSLAFILAWGDLTNAVRWDNDDETGSFICHFASIHSDIGLYKFVRLDTQTNKVWAVLLMVCFLFNTLHIAFDHHHHHHLFHFTPCKPINTKHSKCTSSFSWSIKWSKTYQLLRWLNSPFNEKLFLSFMRNDLNHFIVINQIKKQFQLKNLNNTKQV